MPSYISRYNLYINPICVDTWDWPDQFSPKAGLLSEPSERQAKRIPKYRNSGPFARVILELGYWLRVWSFMYSRSRA